MRRLAGYVVGGAAGGVFVGFVGFMIWGVVAVGLGVEGDWEYFAYTWSNFAAFTLGGAALGATAGLLRAFVRQGAERRAAAASQRRDQERLRTEAVDAREHALRQLATVSRAAEARFRSLPVRLGEAASSLEEAMTHRASGAYSPFWAAIEETCLKLAEYDATVRQLGVDAEAYGTNARTYRELGGSEDVGEFPVGLDEAEATAAAAPVAQTVRDLAYDAQRDPVYAQIWEQRRTTAAVVQGFRSMEAAIGGLRRAVDASVSALEVGVRSLGAQVETVGATVERVGATAEAQRAGLARSLDEAVWYLDNERRRALGWQKY